VALAPCPFPRCRVMALWAGNAASERWYESGVILPHRMTLVHIGTCGATTGARANQYAAKTLSPPRASRADNP